MKRIALSLLTLAALLAAAAPSTEPAGRPMFTNAGLETDANADSVPDGWSCPAGVSWQEEAGNHYLRLKSEQPGQFITVHRAVTLKPDDTLLRLTFRSRHEEIKAGKEKYFDGRIMMNFKDAGGSNLKPGPKTPTFKGTSKEWKEQTIDLPVPVGTETFECMLALFKAESGTLDFDDVSLVSVPGGERVRPAPLSTGPTPPTPAAARKVEPPAPEKLPKELRVVGNQLQTADGKSVWLQGLAVPSLEWSAKGENIVRSIEVGIDQWKANVIRLPVEEDRWFGKGQKDGGIAYRAVVDDAINSAAGRGAYLVIDLHRFRAPEADHVTFWNDVAARYKDHPAILFELFNEPHGISWEVWRNGGPVTDKPKENGVLKENAEPIKKFDSVGMQKLLETVRATGAKNVVIAGGLDWGYDLSGILTGAALDDRTGHGVVYSSHVYPWKGNWQKKFIDVAAKYPLFIGEVGAADERMPFVPPERHEDPFKWSPDMLGAIQKHKLHWTGWAFHPKASPKILLDWEYTPTPYWGEFVKKALNGEQYEMKRMR